MPPDLEGVVEVRDVFMDDIDLAGDVNWRPTLNNGAGQDQKVNGIYKVCCRARKKKYQPVLMSYLCKTNIGDTRS